MVWLEKVGKHLSEVDGAFGAHRELGREANGNGLGGIMHGG